jgi:hypothetical protein
MNLIRMIFFFPSILGGHGGRDQQAVQETGPNAQPLYQTANEQYTPERCNLYQKEFMKCLDQAGGDSSQCQGFWEALKVKILFRILLKFIFVLLKECQRFQGANGRSLISIKFFN